MREEEGGAKRGSLLLSLNDRFIVSKQLCAAPQLGCGML